MKLTADLIEAFAGTYLSQRYDDAKPTPEFHREVWTLYASDQKQACAIAPRDHAKSTAFTFDFILASVCWRASKYVILVGSTEDKAAEQLSNIIEELEENQPLRQDFGIVSFETVTKTEVIAVCDDGHKFRILARGAEQKIRGAMWGGARPDLIVCDDMEDDEQVENKDRRAKFRRWFFRAARPALSKRGKIRVHGTVLHDDALLPRLRRNKQWVTLFYKAHRSYNDFSELLWPERWTAEELRNRQIEFEEDGDAPGYSQEFLNTPLDNNDRYLSKENFIAMSEEDYDTEKVYMVGADFAISKKDKANRTSFTVGGKDVKNYLHVVDQYCGRWNTAEWLELMFEIQCRWQPFAWVVEKGSIWDSVAPFVEAEMIKRNIFLNILPKVPKTDKATRGRTLQKRHKNRGMKFNKEADWYAGYEAELMMFTEGSDAMLDDQFDSTVYLSYGFDLAPEVEEEDFETDEEVSYRLRSVATRGGSHRNAAGY